MSDINQLVREMSGEMNKERLMKDDIKIELIDVFVKKMNCM